MVSWYVPRATFRLVLIVSTVVPPFTIVVGVNLAEANFGSPLTVNATVPENPSGVIWTE
jgi:hypothetical protein